MATARMYEVMFKARITVEDDGEGAVELLHQAEAAAEEIAEDLPRTYQWMVKVRTAEVLGVRELRGLGV